METYLGTAEPKTASLDTIYATSARRRKRAYHRILSGLQANGAYKFLTLTSSPQSPDDIQRSWRRLIMRLQRRGLLKDGYIRITETTHQGRPHYHILFRGGFIEQEQISHLWRDIHKAPIVYISQVRSKRGITNYLAKYIVKDMQGRLSWSYHWLYKGFVKAWIILKRIGRELGISRNRVLTYWQHCCKVRKKPWEVKLWLLNESIEREFAKPAERYSAVITLASLSRQSILIM